MAWWSFLLGTPKSVENITETGNKIATGIVDGLDHLRFEDQERAEFSQRGAEIILQYWKTVGEENSQQSIARRVLATMVLRWFFAALSVAVMCRIGGVFAPALVSVSSFILELTLSGIVGGLVIAIGTIYFGPHQLSKIVDYRKNNE